MTDSMTTAALSDRATRADRRFRSFAAFALGYTLLVILFGALVRITGSGAGCGQHWPSCRGEIVHLPQTVEAAIELTHRITSAASFFCVLVLLIVTHRHHVSGHLARRAAWTAMIAMLVEVLVGALLVLLALVGNNDSIARAAVMAVHLVNTFVLTAALLLVAWCRVDRSGRLLERSAAALLVLVAAFLLLSSVTGAVTALGDTVRPPLASEDALDRLRSSYALTAHFLDRLRAFHPAIATATAVVLLLVGARLSERFQNTQTARLLYFAMGMVIVQACSGVLNIWLSAPGWLQVLHLALALSLWAVWILAWISAPARTRPSTPPNGDESGVLSQR